MNSGGLVLAAASFWVLGFSGKAVRYSLSLGITGRFFIITMFEAGTMVPHS